MKPIQISDFKLGRSIQGFYLCKEKHLRYTRSGDIFLDIVLSDSTGMISGKLWDMVEQFQDRFTSGDPVAVKGKVTEFNNNLQLTVTQVNQATHRQYGKYGFSLDLLISSVEEPLNDLWSRVMKVIALLHKPYKKLTKDIFMDYEQKIRVIPESVHHQNPIRGGFLKHLVTTTEMSIEILPYYPTLNKDLVLCGILLHDIGRVESINDNLQANCTDAGRLIGDVALGVNILQNATSSFKNFPKEILLKLEHIILSHGTISSEGLTHSPRFPEALFVYYINTLDVQMNLMLNSIVNDSNHEWTNDHNDFHVELYKK